LTSPSRSPRAAAGDESPTVSTTVGDLTVSVAAPRAEHPLRQAVRLIAADVDRYSYMLELDGTAALKHENRAVSAARALLMCQGLQAVVVHRVGHAVWRWAPRHRAARAARAGARLGHFAANRVVEATLGISIAERAEIGPGLYIGHFGGVIVGAATLGENCTLSHGTTIGRSASSGQDARPVLGDRVWVGPGAVLAGDVTIGEDAVVGANAVVTRSVPARSAAYGAPAVVRPDRASFRMVVYRGADGDAGRRASLRAADRAVGG